MKAAAIEFLTKPIDPEALVAAIRPAFAKDLEQRQKATDLVAFRGRFALLTPREREVLPQIIRGMLNKQAAAVLGITEVTIQVHRGQIMKKMKADSFADLVRMAGKLGIPEPDRTL
jgi:FixJ family two-component response regulator